MNNKTTDQVRRGLRSVDRCPFCNVDELHWPELRRVLDAKVVVPPPPLEWLARLVEEIGWAVDATEGESYYKVACDLYGVEPRQLNIREPSNDDEDMERINAALTQRKKK